MSEDGSTSDAKSDAAGGEQMRPIAQDAFCRTESDDDVVSRREARWRRVYPDDGHDPELIVLGGVDDAGRGVAGLEQLVVALR